MEVKNPMIRKLSFKTTRSVLQTYKVANHVSTIYNVVSYIHPLPPLLVDNLLTPLNGIQIARHISKGKPITPKSIIGIYMIMTILFPNIPHDDMFCRILGLLAIVSELCSNTINTIT